MYRDQSFSVEELAQHTVDGSGDIRFPDWERLLEPLRGASEVYRCFSAERVSSVLLGDVRLAARTRTNSGHVTALLRAENGRSFFHYDNDSRARLRGKFDSVSLRDAWGPFTLYALVREGSPLQAAIDELEPAREFMDISSPSR